MRATSTEDRMALGREDPDRGGIAALIGRMADGLGKLFTEHLALAKLELAEDARVLGGNLAKIAAFVPFVLVGYMLLCAALGMVLAQWVGYAGGFGIVGGANLLGGGFGIYVASAKLRTHAMMNDSIEEMGRSASVFSGDAASERSREQSLLPAEGQRS
ncbi:MAG: phage holin family protein [Myxococcaceae bacterium]